ncbi:hypothetical protein BKA69DRAFT_1171172 [Paraphysoderma sedebokerense]|nr:hypothetical protein BKA69DRAFT_1171172 [Paraphysoderma sedebokerense]
MVEQILPRLEYITDPPTFPPIQLFADDVKVFVPTVTVTEAQMITNFISLWCDENEMMLNPLKCGFIGLPAESYVKIGNVSIPKVTEYKYLGMPFTYSAVGKNWSELVRLTVYKVFVRSRFEFALGLAWSWAKAKKDKELKLLNPFEEVQRQFVNWVFPSKKPSKNLHLRLSILGLTSIKFRASSAALHMGLSIQELAPTHPISTLVKNFRKFSYSPSGQHDAENSSVTCPSNPSLKIKQCYRNTLTGLAGLMATIMTPVSALFRMTFVNSVSGGGVAYSNLEMQSDAAVSQQMNRTGSKGVAW